MGEINAVFVIGHSPAIVTETLAAMSVTAQDEVCSVSVITTYSGAQTLNQSLFTDGAWPAFVQAYPCFTSCRFTADQVRGCAGEDIRNEQENRDMAESIFSAVRELTADGMPPLMASIAGGRKTMGYYMGFAMSLFGREGDRMTHVLVPEEWEQNRNFMFPPAAEAGRIDLVDIPFIRLRGHLKPTVGKADVEALVQSAQTAIDLSTLEPMVLHIRPRRVTYLGKDVELPDREFTFLQFFAEQKVRHCRRPERVVCGECSDCFLTYDGIDERKEELMRIRSQFSPVYSGNYIRFEEAWQGRRAAVANLHEPLNRIRAAVGKVFGADPRAGRLDVCNAGKRGEACYGIMADKNQIRIEKD